MALFNFKVSIYFEYIPVFKDFSLIYSCKNKLLEDLKKERKKKLFIDNSKEFAYFILKSILLL